VTNAAGHADHLLPTRRPIGRAVDTDTASDGVSAGPQAGGRQIVDDGDLARRVHFLLAKPAALEEGDAHGLQVAGAHRIDFGDGLSLGPGHAGLRSRHPSAVIVAAERKRVDGAGGLHAGQSANGIQDAAEEQSLRLGVVDVAVAGGNDDRSQRVVGVKTGIGAQKADEARGERAADH